LRGDGFRAQPERPAQSFIKSFRTVERLGVCPNSTAQLEAALAELQRMQATILGNWPWSDRPVPDFDPAKVAEAKAEIDRGEHEDLEDMIRELQGPHR
jgi:hypothetical protein